MIPHPSWIEVDLSQFRRNLAAIREKIGGALCCLAVKANAYGHGLVEMAREAVSAGIDYLAVSCLKEGASLREAGISMPILVLGAIHEEQIRGLVDYELEISISSKYKAQLVQEKCVSWKKKCRVHLEIDTGMQRTGVRPSSALDLLRFLHSCSSLHLIGIYSHLATSDVPNDPVALKQIASFQTLQEQIGKGKFLWHLANSGGVLLYPNSHFDMVRPGLISYGYFPNGQSDATIGPCFSVKSKISYFKVVGPGEGVSYGHRYRTQGQSRIVTVPIGYGDGYRRAFSNQAPVLIRGRRYRVAGTVCMDQFMVDIGSDEAYVGDEVTLVGRQGDQEISLWELSKLADTIPYELLSDFNERLPRVYYTPR